MASDGNGELGHRGPIHDRKQRSGVTGENGRRHRETSLRRETEIGKLSRREKENGELDGNRHRGPTETSGTGHLGTAARETDGDTALGKKNTRRAHTTPHQRTGDGERPLGTVTSTAAGRKETHGCSPRNTHGSSTCTARGRARGGRRRREQRNLAAGKGDTVDGDRKSVV